LKRIESTGYELFEGERDTPRYEPFERERQQVTSPSRERKTTGYEP
jgi:hypothetical protein